MEVMDKGQYARNLAKEPRGQGQPLSVDLNHAYLGQLGVLQKLVRWHDGEHSFWAMCTCCSALLTISAVHTPAADGTANDTFGHWVALPAGANEKDAGALHAAIVDAPLHMTCRHGETNC